MPQDSNFFLSLSESSKTHTNSEIDRKKTQKKISKTLSRLFKRCSDSVSTYDLYSKMFEILNADNKKQKKISKKEFDLIANGGKKTKDTTAKTVLDLASLDGDIENDITWSEIKTEYEEYFDETSNVTDTFEFTGEFKFNEENTNKIDKKEAAKIQKEKYKKLKEAGFKKGLARELLDNNCDIEKAIKFKNKGVRNGLILNAVRNGWKLKDVLKLQKLNLTFSDKDEALDSRYDINDIMALCKLGIKSDAVSEALALGYTADDIEKYKRAGIPKEFINDAISGTREHSLCAIPNLNENYNLVNELYHGKRIDSSLKNWTVNINGQEVKIKTDNNMFTEEYARQYGIPENGNPISNSEQEAIYNALMQMASIGQDIPSEIYYTDVIRNGAAGVFSARYDNSIFVSSNIRSQEYLQEVIYHESAHFKDHALGMSQYNIKYISHLNDPDLISPEESSIDFTIDDEEYSIPTSSIERIISRYSLTNNQEFVAEVTAMITSGKIKQKPDGSYRIMTKNGGKYKNAKGKTVKLRYEDIQTINNIMALYNYLTEGKIVTPMQVG